MRKNKSQLMLNSLTLFMLIALFSQTTFSKPLNKFPAVRVKSQATSPVDSILDRQVDSVAWQALREDGAPSASVAVVLNGKIAYVHAYGYAKLNPGIAATTDMRYAIGSISKQFTAASILILQQQGKLSLDDPISKWLPKLTRANEVTVREILSHTSGYQDFWPQDYVPTMMLKPILPEEILKSWAMRPLDFEPGTRWQYSNTNFVIAARIVEKITGKPFFNFLKENILNPLGLSDAVNFDQNKMSKTDPSGYMRYALGPLRPAPEEGSGWMWGAGELAMTPTDLAKWDISMIDENLLQPASYHQMEEEVRLKNGAGTNYGLGVEVAMNDGHFTISHGGEVSGFTSKNIVFPEDRAAVVVLTNQDAASTAAVIANGIKNIIFSNQDAETKMRTDQAKKIFEGLQQGMIDRSLFTPDANAYFSKIALEDFQSSLSPLGAPITVVQTSEEKRGGMFERSFSVVLQDRTLRVWTYQTPDGMLEQYQVAP